MKRNKRLSAHEKLKKWKETHKITLDGLALLLGKVDATVSFDRFQLSRFMNDDRVAPSDKQRTVIAIVTGIPEWEWLPADLQRSRKKAKVG